MVERTPEHFEPVQATNYKLDHGDLLLYREDENFMKHDMVIAYARGQWLTFHFDKDYEWSKPLTTANEDARAAVAKSRGVVQ